MRPSRPRRTGAPTHARALRLAVACAAAALSCAGQALAHHPTLAAIPSSTPTGAGAAAGAQLGELHADSGFETGAPAVELAVRDVAAAARTLERAPLAPVTTGSARVAVVLLAFADDPARPFTAADVEWTMFGAPDSVASLFAEQSGGRLTVSGAVVDWLVSAHSTSTCDFAGWAESASAALGPAASEYTHLLVIVPRTASCQWAGLAYVGGNTAWLNGTAAAGALAHELGHNLGLGHARTWRCEAGGAPAVLSDSCALASEYGDPFTPMGAGVPVHVSAVHKVQLGWLAPEEIVTVATSGTFTLAPLSAVAGSGVRALRIPRGPDWLYLEYRQPLGPFDGLLAQGSLVPGVTARLASELPGEDWNARLLDATPETDTFADASLAAGRSLTDPVTGVRISTLATAPEAATISVELGIGGDTAPPSAPELTRATGFADGRVELFWTVSADDVGVVRYELLRDGAVILASSETAGSDTLAAGSRARYSVRAVDAAGNVSAGSNVRSVRIAGRTLQAPRRLAAVARVTGQRALVALSWRGSTREDVRFLVWRGKSLLGRTRRPRWVDGLPLAAPDAVYRVVAVRDDGARAGSAPLVVSPARLAARAARTSAPLRLAARR